MCRAQRSIRRRPTPVPSELQQALQASVMVTLNRRVPVVLDDAATKMVADQGPGELGVDPLRNQSQALGSGDTEPDPLLSLLRKRTSAPMFDVRREA